MGGRGAVRGREGRPWLPGPCPPAMAVAEADQLLEEAVRCAWRGDAAEVSLWSPFRSRSVPISHKHNHGEHKCHEWSCSRCRKNGLKWAKKTKKAVRLVIDEWKLQETMQKSPSLFLRSSSAVWGAKRASPFL